MNHPPVITYEDAKRQAEALGVNTEVISIERLRVGMNVELEHGTRSVYTDVTGGTNSHEIIAKIALAHFEENPGSAVFPDYYHFLEQMEEKSERYWREWKNRGGIRPKVFKQQAHFPFAIPGSQ